MNNINNFYEYIIERHGTLSGDNSSEKFARKLVKYLCDNSDEIKDDFVYFLKISDFDKDMVNSLIKDKKIGVDLSDYDWEFPKWVNNVTFSFDMSDLGEKIKGGFGETNFGTFGVEMNSRKFNFKKIKDYQIESFVGTINHEMQHFFDDLISKKNNKKSIYYQDAIETISNMSDKDNVIVRLAYIDYLTNDTEVRAHLQNTNSISKIIRMGNGYEYLHRDEEDNTFNEYKNALIFIKRFIKICNGDKDALLKMIEISYDNPREKDYVDENNNLKISCEDFCNHVYKYTKKILTARFGEKTSLIKALESYKKILLKAIDRQFVVDNETRNGFYLELSDEELERKKKENEEKKRNLRREVVRIKNQTMESFLDFVNVDVIKTNGLRAKEELENAISDIVDNIEKDTFLGIKDIIEYVKDNKDIDFSIFEKYAVKIIEFSFDCMNDYIDDKEVVSKPLKFMDGKIMQVMFISILRIELKCLLMCFDDTVSFSEKEINMFSRLLSNKKLTGYRIPKTEVFENLFYAVINCLIYSKEMNKFLSEMENADTIIQKFKKNVNDLEKKLDNKRIDFELSDEKKIGYNRHAFTYHEKI